MPRPSPSTPRIAGAALAALLALAAAPGAGARTVAFAQREVAGPARMAAVDVGTRAATRFVVRAGDTPVRSGERTERVASVAQTGARPGADRVYRWSTRFPLSFTPVPNSTWNIFTQWHGSAPDGCHPNIALQVNTQLSPPMLRLQVRGGALGAGCAPQQSRSWDFAPLRRGRWEDLALHVGWSDHPGGGYVALTLDGRTVVPRTALATLYAGQRAYLKQGFYRAPSPWTTTVLHSAVTLADDGDGARAGAAADRP
ncbi:MAG TPA: heparin lyase I family protein [Baekduia sp.]|uniref:heparin lyase I family protein n=1 Tax=Baekduia sp. TaxID=2600305 RepID=UPI002D78680B|nr:heparin lyase I family protein [Baekduia sp.]HET6508479.1 heparin lyase I family protein [Baekduia sp.]